VKTSTLVVLAAVLCTGAAPLDGGKKELARLQGTWEMAALDPGKEPKAIDMYFPDGPNLPKLSKGVYDFDGDTFRVCRSQAPGEDRPRQIGSWPATNLFVGTWNRIKP
jgi:hypothetical protein